MDREDFIKTITLRPIFRGYDIGEIKKAISLAIPVAISRIIKRYPFNFAVGETTVSGGSVDGTATYSCPGESDDASDVISVRYGDDLKVLDEFSGIEMDREDDWVNPTEVYAWARVEDTYGQPQIKLFGTPDADGETIKYRYTKKVVDYTAFPTDWLYVLQDSVMACLGKVGIGEKGDLIFMNHRSDFEQSIREMIDHYDKRQGGPRPVQRSRQVKNRNIARNDLHGYSG